MTHARKTGGPRPTTLRLVPTLPPEPAPTTTPSQIQRTPTITSSPFEFDALLDSLRPVEPYADEPAVVEPRAEVPAPAEPTTVPGSPDGPSIPEPSIPAPDEPATPAAPEEPVVPIDPVPQPETPDPSPAEVPGF